MKKAGLDTINAMVCSNSAMLAWRASKPNSPLHGLFQSMTPNGAWNAIPDLRVAKSEGKA